MKIIKDVDISSFNAYDWIRNYTMREDYQEVLKEWSYEKIHKFNEYVEEKTDELNEHSWDLEDYINDFESDCEDGEEKEDDEDEK